MLAAGLFFRYNLDNPWGYIVLAIALLVWVGWTKLIYRARKKAEGKTQ